MSDVECAEIDAAAVRAGTTRAAFVRSAAVAAARGETPLGTTPRDVLEAVLKATVPVAGIGFALERAVARLERRAGEASATIEQESTGAPPGELLSIAEECLNAVRRLDRVAQAAREKIK